MKLEQLKCGECAGTKHELYLRLNGEIIVQCIQCHSQSEIVVTQPKIRINHYSGNGTLSVF